LRVWLQKNNRSSIAGRARTFYFFTISSREILKSIKQTLKIHFRLFSKADYFFTLVFFLDSGYKNYRLQEVTTILLIPVYLFSNVKLIFGQPTSAGEGWIGKGKSDVVGGGSTS
jgi:hypothetical protein